MAGFGIALDLNALAGQIRDRICVLSGQRQLALDYEGRDA
jgi:hypothetical protein